MTREECLKEFGLMARKAWTDAARDGVPKWVLAMTCDYYAGRITQEYAVVRISGHVEYTAFGVFSRAIHNIVHERKQHAVEDRPVESASQC